MFQSLRGLGVGWNQGYIFLGSQWRNQKAVQLFHEIAEVAWREEMEMM